MKKLLIYAVEKIHLLVFGHEMSGQMREFLNNLSWSFYAGIISMPISMVIGTLAGRYLGPAEYGNYNLVILISSYAVVFAFLGLDISTIKNIVKAKTEEGKYTSFMSSAVFVIFMLVILSVLGLVVGPKLIGKTTLPHNIIYFVILFTIVTSFKSILDILVRALEQFKLQAIGRLIEISTLSLIFIFIVIKLKRMDSKLYLGMIMLGMIVVIVYLFKNLRKYFKGFSFEVLKRQLSEGKFFMLSGILGTIFISSDRLLIAEYIDVTSLGVYSAYYVASLGLVKSLSLMLTNVLFPATAKLRDKTFTKKLDQFLLKGFVPFYLLICAAIFVFLKIFGKEYPLKPSYLLLFALISILYFVQIVYNIIILDASRKRYVQYFYISNLVNLLTVAYYFVLMQFLSKSIILILVGFSVNLVINILIQRRFIKIMREDALNA